MGLLENLFTLRCPQNTPFLTIFSSIKPLESCLKWLIHTLFKKSYFSIGLWNFKFMGVPKKPRIFSRISILMDIIKVGVSTKYPKLSFRGVPKKPQTCTQNTPMWINLYPKSPNNQKNYHLLATIKSNF